MNQSAYPPPPKKGLSGLTMVGIGCGVFFVLGCIGISMLVAKSCSKIKEVAGDFEKDPARTAAILMVRSNPDLELVRTDDSKREITIRNTKTGEVTTMSFDQAEQGKFKVTDSKGNETTVDASAASQGRVTVKGPDGETVISGSASEAALPAWFPAYPGATAKQGGMRTEKNGIISGLSASESSDTAAQVQEFYTAKLKAAGFKVETNAMKDSGANIAVVNATKSDTKQTANVLINSEKGKTTITLTYEGPK